MNRRSRWQAWKESLRHRYGPRIADLLIDLSTFEARRKLKHIGQLNILLDNSTLGHGVTHESAWISTGPKKWGGGYIDTGYSARIPVHSPDDDRDVYRNVRYLPGIASLARHGYINLCTSGELRAERFHQPIGRFRGYGHFGYSVFNGAKLKFVDLLPPMIISPNHNYTIDLREQQLERINKYNDPLYLSIRRLLGEKHSLDAWHIRTAETYKLFCFLTMDFKLLRMVDTLRHKEPIKSLNTKIMTPEIFGKHFNIRPVHPYILTYHEASFPVRSDLCWPDSRRQPRWADNKRNQSRKS